MEGGSEQRTTNEHFIHDDATLTHDCLLLTYSSLFTIALIYVLYSSLDVLFVLSLVCFSTRRARLKSERVQESNQNDGRLALLRDSPSSSHSHSRTQPSSERNKQKIASIP